MFFPPAIWELAESMTTKDKAWKMRVQEFKSLLLHNDAERKEKGEAEKEEAENGEREGAGGRGRGGVVAVDGRT